jgi:XTP/dITP diphosphohydrolase
MRILIATSNPHKLEEIRAVFTAEQAQRGGRGPTPELVRLIDLGLTGAEPVEDQATFEGNALLKARYYAKAAGMLCLADDSGLEVDALGGAPGVLSARYAGVSGSRQVVDPANNKLLLARLSAVPPQERTARFVCSMALVANDGQPGRILAQVRGTVEGRILGPEGIDHRGRGSNGFGYDPLFLIPELGLTTAELSAQQKNAISHRGRASRLMWRELDRLAGRS